MAISKLQIDQLQPGMLLGETIPHPYAYKSLLEEGTVLTENLIQKLKALNLAEISVRPAIDYGNSFLPAKLGAAKELYSHAYQAMDQLFGDARSGKNLKVAPARKMVNDLVDFVTEDYHSLLHLRALRQTDCASLHHSVNVSIFTVLLGQFLGFEKTDLLDLGLAGLLHDIGKSKIPPEILLKKAQLTPREFEIIKTHSILGLDILKESEKLPERVKVAVVQHHEKCDGSGYPFGLKSQEIDSWAKIVALADIYEALSSDRSYRQKHFPHLVIDYLLSEASKGTLDKDYTETFARSIAIYPMGVKVLLSTNEVGEVIDIPKGTPWRPTLLVNEPVKRVINLVERPCVYIKDVAVAIESKVDSVISNSKRVLVVDDSPFMRTKLKNILKETGNQIVGEAENGEEAVAKYKELNPDMVFLDITMPKKDGLAALEEIRAYNNNAAVIVISAIQQKEAIMKALKLGAINYIIKPFETEKVREALNEYSPS